MPRLHAYELLPDDAGRDAVLADWQALRDAGLRSQLDHKGMTNTPHVTVVTAEVLGAEQDALAVRHLGPALPVEVRTSGIALLGGSRVSVVRLFDVPDDLMRAVLALREDVPHRQHPGWLPHVTLGASDPPCRRRRRSRGARVRTRSPCASPSCAAGTPTPGPYAPSPRLVRCGTTRRTTPRSSTIDSAAGTRDGHDHPSEPRGDSPKGSRVDRLPQ